MIKALKQKGMDINHIENEDERQKSDDPVEQSELGMDKKRR